MEVKLADELIGQGADLVHVRMIGGPYFGCYTRFNPEFNDRCHFIPSWVWLKDKRCFRIHYLDIPLLEATALTNGYQVRYEPTATDQMKAMKVEYTDRPAWKKVAKLGDDLMKSMKMREVNGVMLPPLRQYQVLGSQFMFRVGRVLNADGMGSGKTSQTIGAVMLNKLAGQPYKTLVISQDGKASFGDVEKAVDSNDTVPSSRQTHIVDIQALEMDRVVILPEKKS